MSSSNLRGLCPPPFLQEALFPETGGCMYPFNKSKRPSTSILTRSKLSLEGFACLLPLFETLPAVYHAPSPIGPILMVRQFLPIKYATVMLTGQPGFEQRTSIANWVNLAAFILSVYLVLSFIVLPVKFTHRHYLSVCVTLGVIFLEVRKDTSRYCTGLTQSA